MMKPSILRTPPFLRLLAATGGLGLALSASTALAQYNRPVSDAGATNPNAASSPSSAAGASAPSSVPGVTVQAPRPEQRPPIPADKAAAYDQEVAKAEAWKRYRSSTPPLSEGTIAQGKDYPGLQSLLPQGEPTEGR
jgi:hypothetical protein